MKPDSFQIEMLPGCEGDCVLLTWGTRRLLVDGGRKATYAALRRHFSQVPDDERNCELFVITHIDRDHIEGALALIEDKARPVRFGDIWFNGYDHLFNRSIEAFGPIQGERLTKALLDQRLPWNQGFQRNAIEVTVRRSKQMAGGLTLTVLSPTRSKLKALIPEWKNVCESAGLLPGVRAHQKKIPRGMEGLGAIDIAKLAAEPFKPDDSAPNGSSIALLAEYKGKRALLAGDAHPELLESAVRKLAQKQGGKLPLDGLKVSHHGSAYNTSSTFLSLISCKRFLISTNGSLHGHPDDVAMARIISSAGPKKEIVFNYRTQQTSKWNNRNWEAKYGYTTRYPSEGDNGIVSIVL